MRLSEAIKLGSLLGPQEFGRVFGPNDGSCALGAACLAVGIRTGAEDGIPMALLDYFPALRSQFYGVPLSVSIIQMNDRHRLRREDIADLLVKKGLDCESVDVPGITQASKEAVCV